MLHFFKKETIHQFKNSTSYNRYPNIFSETKQYFLKNNSKIKILSYGCSTGEECFSLREYFPEAVIVGLDIDVKNLEICKSKNQDSNIIFLESTTKNIEHNGPYDIIFCMSVLCRWPDSKELMDISNLYSFKKFEKALISLDFNLKLNGVLVLYNCNFLFSDTKIYNKYKALASPMITESGFVQKFDKNNFKIENSTFSECIFIKVQK